MVDEKKVEAHRPKTLQRGILERFMSNREVDKLLAEYRGSKKSFGSGVRRDESLNRPILPEHMQALKSYLDDTDCSLVELDKQAKRHEGWTRYTAQMAALRWLAQNRHVLKE